MQLVPQPGRDVTRQRCAVPGGGPVTQQPVQVGRGGVEPVRQREPGQAGGGVAQDVLVDAVGDQQRVVDGVFGAGLGVEQVTHLRGGAQVVAGAAERPPLVAWGGGGDRLGAVALADAQPHVVGVRVAGVHVVGVVGGDDGQPEPGRQTGESGNQVAFQADFVVHHLDEHPVAAEQVHHAGQVRVGCGVVAAGEGAGDRPAQAAGADPQPGRGGPAGGGVGGTEQRPVHPRLVPVGAWGVGLGLQPHQVAPARPCGGQHRQVLGRLGLAPVAGGVRVRRGRCRRAPSWCRGGGGCRPPGRPRCPGWV